MYIDWADASQKKTFDAFKHGWAPRSSHALTKPFAGSAHVLTDASGLYPN